MERNPGNPQSGEGGHRERDRQASKQETPQKSPLDPADAPAPKTAQKRSEQAMQKPPDARGDQLHPGPWRDELEKSKGDLHHDQHETEKDMDDAVEDL